MTPDQIRAFIEQEISPANTERAVSDYAVLWILELISRNANLLKSQAYGFHRLKPSQEPAPVARKKDMGSLE